MGTLATLLHNIAVFISQFQISAEDIQLWVALLTAGILAITLGAGRLARWIKRPSPALKTLGTAAAILLAVLVAYTYFYYSRTPGSWIHRWDIFHSSMNSRYFKELGYFELYECTLTLGSSSISSLDGVERIRDLNTLDYVDAETVIQTSDCAARFSEQRRSEFIRDLEFWDELMPGRWQALLQDKGYNGTPFYTFLYQRLIGRQPFEVSQITALALVDVFMLAIAFAGVLRAYGPRVALFSFLFFGVNFPNRFVHMGGAILRFDYIVLLILAICALKLKKPGLSGALIALSSMSRVFPFLFAVGFGIKAAVGWFKTRKISSDTVWFFAWFAATLLIAFLVSLSIGGIEAWTQFLANSIEHNQNTAGFRIGFRHLFMVGGNLFGPEGFTYFEEKTQIFNSHLVSYFLAITLMVIALAWIGDRIDAVNFTILFGMLSFYLLFASTRYYYSILVLLFLFVTDKRFWTNRKNTWLWLFLFLVSAATYIAWQFNNFEPFIYNTFISALLGIGSILIIAVLHLSLPDRFPHEQK